MECMLSQAVTNSANTVYATKRLIGRRYDDPHTKKEAEVRMVVVVCGCLWCFEWCASSCVVCIIMMGVALRCHELSCGTMRYHAF